MKGRLYKNLCTISLDLRRRMQQLVKKFHYCVSVVQEPAFDTKSVTDDLFEKRNQQTARGESDITLAFAVTSLQDKLGCGLAVGPRWFLVNMMPDAFFSSDNIPFFLKCMPKASSWIALLLCWKGYFRVWLKVLRKYVHDCKTSQTTVESKF